ncbi:MAG: DUF4398 domain-containing protein [Polyangiaceae bacterium]
MKRNTLPSCLRLSVALVFASMSFAVVACGGSYPVPQAQLSAAEAASRSAKELGADKDPKAQLHAQLASEEIAQAKQLMKDGDNRRADSILQRAAADAELAVMLAKEKAAKEELEQLHQKLNALKSGK